MRLERATTAVRDAIATATDIPHDSIGIDEDLLDDLDLNSLEQETLRLICEEIFSVAVPANLWDRARYRTAASLAGWLISRSDENAWIEAKQQSQSRRKCA